MKTCRSVLQEKVDRLINVSLSEGVQPSDLADNIFEKPYSKMTLSKKNGLCYVELTFEETIEGVIVETVLRYTYDLERTLLRIEEVVDSSVIVEWDREQVENQLVSEIVDILDESPKKDLADNFINTLPKNIKIRFQIAAKKAA